MTENLDYAPGLEWRRRSDGHVPIWVAPAKARKAGFSPETVRLAADPLAERAPKGCIDHRAFAATCRRLHAEALQHLSGRAKRDPIYDGTFNSVFDMYERHEDSPIHTVKHNTRDTYGFDIKALRQAIGARRLDRITGPDLKRWHREFKAPKKAGASERIRSAHSKMTMLRMTLGFGVFAGIKDAKRLVDILSEIRFENSQPRDQVMEADQIVAVRAAAHARNRPSIALASAIMFECLLRQRDVIGEWRKDRTALPAGALVDRGQVWTTGLVWGQHINGDLILDKPTSKSRGRKHAVYDLKHCPMIMDELALIPAEKRIGPLIICETTARPWRRRHFMEEWRECARAAGVPDAVWCMDTRAGGLSEADEAGADLGAMRHAATHAQASTTVRYLRKPLKKTSAVSHLRVASRSPENAS
jgi:hypothetical protein